MSEAPRLANLKYQVSSVLGTADGTTVLLVSDRYVEGGVFALKVISRDDPKADLEIERARAEAAASAKLHHPSILEVHDFRVRRSWFRVNRAELLMPYVEGKTLAGLTGLRIAPAILIFARAASALAHMHRRGVFHGGLRPSKVMLARAGGVKVRGYGLSLVSDPFRSQIKLNGNYAAPEQLKDGVVDARSDIYNLGATMYHVLTGQPAGRSLGRSEGEKLSKPVALNPKIPAPLNDLIVACLQSGPGRRPPGMFEIAQQLEDLAKGLGVKEASLVGLAADPP